MSSTIAIEINGKPFNVTPQSTIIEAADQAGIYIPRFCYHKKLSVAANCRMCLVEVEKSGKPLPACATPVMPGMKVLTRSDKAKAAQQAVMEFLLINHPLDCPICDQGGQCELQDLAMRYGQDNSAFTEAKRAVPDDDLGSLVATEMTRCIHCTRCVRFGTEIAGIQELGATGRGENMKITTYVQQSLRSELSANIIDLCPVGALTSKPFRFKARAWELQQVPAIAPHDCLGSHIAIHTRQQQVMRVVPREHEAINETWLSDRDRYSYLGIESPARLKQPMIKVGDGWQETDWPTALGQAVRYVQATVKQHGPEQLAALISPSATLEEMYLLQALWRHLGSHHIDHRLRQIDTRDQDSFPLHPPAEIAIADLEQCDVILLIGSNIQREQPLLAQRLRKAVKNGARILSVNCLDYHLSFELANKIVVPPQQLLAQIKALVDLLRNQDSETASDLSSPQNPVLQSMAAQLKSAKRAAVLLGALAYHHPEAASLRHAVMRLAQITHAAALHLTEGANSAGAWIAGAVPHRGPGGSSLTSDTGLSAQAMLAARLKAYFLVNVEPHLDCANPAQAQAALQAADYVVALTSFKSPALLATADVILPLAVFAETAGTFVNIEGRWQSFPAAVSPVGEARPGWKILHALSNSLGLSEQDYPTAEAVREAVRSHCEPALSSDLSTQQAQRLNMQGIERQNPYESREGLLMRITEWPLYSADALVRQATALQQAASHEPTGAYINPQLAQRLKLVADQTVILQQGKAASAPLPVIIDTRVPDDCVWTLGGRAETASLGDSFAELQILAVSTNG